MDGTQMKPRETLFSNETQMKPQWNLDEAFMESFFSVDGQTLIHLSFGLVGNIYFAGCGLFRHEKNLRKSFMSGPPN